MKLSPRYDGPEILVIDGPADDQAEPVRRQRRRLETLLAGLDDDQWRAPSRCDGWNVQDVVAHIVGVNAFWEASVSAGLAGAPTRVLATFDPVVHPPKMIEPMRALAPREILEQFVASNDGFLGALAPLDRDAWLTTGESPVGHVSMRLLAQHALWDSWVHERDIAIPLGQTPAVEADEVASCLQYAAALGPALTVGQHDAFTGELAVVATDPDVHFTLAVGELVAVRDDLPPATTPCLRGRSAELADALSLRAPLPDDTPDEWRLLLNSLATMFDSKAQPSVAERQG